MKTLERLNDLKMLGDFQGTWRYGETCESRWNTLEYQNDFSTHGNVWINLKNVEMSDIPGYMWRCPRYSEERWNS